MRILMATMQLDIGGAETHIVELSKALARHGMEVFVASKGGAYVKELEEDGIKHFEVPLNNKKPGSMISAYKSLERIILDYKIDVVHAHARIPGFLCGLLQKKHGFRFVTTAHWVFDTRFPFNLLTNWGDRSLAVSDDIKQYLVDNYGCQPDNIRVTINGVDMEKFSENVDFSDVAKEFSFGENRTRIVYVSRMDVDRSYAAHKLIEAIPDLYEKIPNLEVVVVGGGNDFDRIKEEAEAMNEKMGSRIVIITGGRTDINKFVASGDVFVGVSRAALEAMACRKPAIIAGNEGYIGIFDEDKLQISIDTNFCCRGCEMTSTEQLRDDLLTVLAPEKTEYRKHLGDVSLDTVKKYYSVETMANDAVKMYISVIKDSKINQVDTAELADIEKYLIHGNSKRDIDAMISGYYGFHNSGDDSILSAIISNLRKKCPNISITVLSKNPQETARIHDVNAIDRFNIFSIMAALKKTKLLISGGGSLLQDVTSSASLYYYLTVMRLARLCGAKVMLYANGIGPITKKRNIRCVKRVVGKTDLITLREKNSRDELQSILEGNVPVFVTADPVYALENGDDRSVEQAIARAGISEKEEFFVIAIREWKYSDKEIETKIAEFADAVSRKFGIVPLIVPMQDIYDKAISQRIADKINCKSGLLEGGLSPKTMIGVVGRAEFVLGMRLHTLIYAVKNAVPAIALEYDPKVAAVMESAGQRFSMKVEDIITEELCSLADEIMEQREEICKQLLEKSHQYNVLAEKNIDMVIDLLR